MYNLTKVFLAYFAQVSNTFQKAPLIVDALLFYIGIMTASVFWENSFSLIGIVLLIVPAVAPPLPCRLDTD